MIRPSTRKPRSALWMGALCLVVAMGIAPTTADAAPGCRRPVISGADQTINPSRINQRLLNEALVAEVNYLRCRRGLPALAPTTGLRRAAEGHSLWMARSRSLTHVSNQSGRRTPSQRILGATGKVHMGSENIAKVSLYRLDEVGRFRITDASNCGFAAANGARIGRHSYASLAQYVASLWNRSQGHRENMLDRRARMVGTAAGFDASGRNCGQIYLTQAFAG